MISIEEWRSRIGRFKGTHFKMVVEVGVKGDGRKWRVREAVTLYLALLVVSASFTSVLELNSLAFSASASSGDTMGRTGDAPLEGHTTTMPDPEGAQTIWPRPMILMNPTFHKNLTGTTNGTATVVSLMSMRGLRDLARGTGEIQGPAEPVMTIEWIMNSSYQAMKLLTSHDVETNPGPPMNADKNTVSEGEGHRVSVETSVGPLEISMDWANCK